MKLKRSISLLIAVILVFTISVSINAFAAPPEAIRLEWVAGEDGKNGEFVVPAGVTLKVGDKIIFTAGAPSVSSGDKFGPIVNMGTSWDNYGQPWSSSQGESWVYTMKAGINKINVLTLHNLATNTGYDLPETVTVFNYDFDNPPAVNTSKKITLVWKPNADGTGKFELPDGITAKIGDKLIFPAEQPSYTYQGDVLKIHTVGDEEGWSGNMICPWANVVSQTLKEGDNKIYLLNGWSASKNEYIAPWPPIEIFKLTLSDKPPATTIRLKWIDGKDGENGKFVVPSGSVPKVGDKLIFPTDAPSVYGDGKFGPMVNIGASWDNYGQPWSNSQGESWEYVMVDGINKIRVLSLYDLASNASADISEDVTVFNYDFANPPADEDNEQGDKDKDKNIIDLVWKLNSDGTGSFSLPDGVTAKIGDKVTFPKEQPTYKYDGKILFLNTLSFQDNWDGDEISPWKDKAIFTLKEGENKVYLLDGWNSETDKYVAPWPPVEIFNLKLVDPNKPLPKTVRLELVDKPTDGKYLRIPANTTINVGDTIIFPKDQFHFKSGNYSGPILNLGTDTGWKSFGQPWKDGAKGDGWSFIAKEGLNEIYVMSIFDLKTMEAQNLQSALLFSFNSGDKGINPVSPSTGDNSLPTAFGIIFCLSAFCLVATAKKLNHNI